MLSCFLLIALSQLPKLKFLVMLNDVIDSDFKTYQQFRELTENFTEQNQVSLILRSSKGELTQQEHCAIIGWTQTLRKNTSGIKEIFSSYGPKELLDIKKLKFQPILIPDCSKSYSDQEIKNQLYKIQKSLSGHILTNKAASDVFVSIYLENLDKDESSFGHFNANVYDEIVSSFDTIILKNFTHIESQWVGTGTYQYFLLKAYKQMSLVNVVTTIFVLLGFYIIFKSFMSGALILCTYSISLILLYGIMGYLQYPIDSLTSSAPILLLVATLQDYIFYLTSLKSSKNSKEAFQKILIPSFFTSLTTIIGFGSLALSELSIIQRFGIICAIGALIEWMVVFLILPRIIDYFKLSEKMHSTSNRSFKLEKVFGKLLLPKYLAYIIILIPFLYLFTQGAKLRVDDSPDKVFPKNHYVPKASNYLIDSRGWKNEVSLIFPKNINEDQVMAIVEELKKTIPQIIFHESYYETRDYLLRKEQPQTLLSTFDRYLRSSPWTERWFSSKKPLQRVLLYLNTTDVEEISRIRKTSQRICESRCYLAGIVISYSEFGLKILQTLQSSFSVCFILTSLILAGLLVNFSINHKLLILLTSLWGPCFMLFMFSFFEIGIYFATSAVMSILVGLAGDNSIQFIFTKNKKSIIPGIMEKEEASLYSTVFMILAASSLMFSEFDGVRKIGLLLIVGSLLGLIGDVILLKSVIKKEDHNES